MSLTISKEETDMELFQLLLLLSALLCSLVAGFVLCFAIIVMPGIKTLSTLDFLRSFKAMDGIIQNNQPLFMFVWLGSAGAIVWSAILGFWQLQSLDRGLLIFACSIYIVGVHAPTITVNIPLNNRLQSKNLDAATQPELEAIGKLFKTRWVRWNTIRTAVSILTTLLLLALLLRL